MVCQNCGQESPSQARFCVRCGKLLPPAAPEPAPAGGDGPALTVTPQPSLSSGPPEDADEPDWMQDRPTSQLGAPILPLASVSLTPPTASPTAASVSPSVAPETESAPEGKPSGKKSKPGGTSPAAPDASPVSPSGAGPAGWGAPTASDRSPFTVSERSPDQFGPSPFPGYLVPHTEQQWSRRSLALIIVGAILTIVLLVVGWRFLVSPMFASRTSPASTAAPSPVAAASPTVAAAAKPAGTSSALAPPPAAKPTASPVPTRVPNSLTNGTEITPAKGEKGLGKLTIRNGTSKDAAAKLVIGSTDPKSWQTQRFVYVKAGQTVVIEGIAAGTYRLAFIAGVDWDAEGRKFLRETSGALFDDPFEFKETPTPQGTQFSTWEVSLNPVAGGTGKTTGLPDGAFGSD